MEETGHIDWSMAMENLRQRLNEDFGKPRFRLKTKVLQKTLVDPQILTWSLIARLEGTWNSGHGLPHCCSGPHPSVTMAGLGLFVREERAISASSVTEINVSDSWADTEEFGGSDIITLNS
ncbi:uncharacterized protein BO88DRAFT_447343 [Aspergillus vadensis CBS 113365]|uniref:Uncharacterized protein n=1 Tax=Aspergillus vadensis (strain CBS 113365 / IMI 142717 / IBT 24658) TaxID=1448311 RepID=A0A319AVW6_ASPVC|nr:hypothetical protein BO88DRAFT_447343 [Aspergillus vadensis CBS 113365]PYH63845.1 hypothetical protein BO88DRAFT_447343 [Aspergillus vadensis CBS 113365]